MKADGRRNRERANDANDGMHNTATGVTATVTWPVLQGTPYSLACRPAVDFSTPGLVGRVFGRMVITAVVLHTINHTRAFNEQRGSCELAVSFSLHGPRAHFASVARRSRTVRKTIPVVRRVTFYCEYILVVLLIYDVFLLFFWNKRMNNEIIVRFTRNWRMKETTQRWHFLRSKLIVDYYLDFGKAGQSW